MLQKSSRSIMDSALIRERLQRRRQELDGRIARIGSDLRREVTPVEGGFADQAAERGNDTVLDAIGLSAEVELRQIDGALHRLTDGRYGECEKCGGRIAPARLQAVPYAITCAECPG
ncbi:MAG TPA: TraR/DksA C4-type zinc finger protein [Steroidobacteraceae bacterium]|nr:TraR/DksA C4-type zinc finger protein [Steroidobacteraceae bacterium]